MLREDAILEAFDAGLEENELLPAFKRLEAWLPRGCPGDPGVRCPVSCPSLSHDIHHERSCAAPAMTEKCGEQNDVASRCTEQPKAAIS